MESSLLTQIIAIAVALLYLAAIVSAIEAILESRTSQGAIAWAISLFTFPVLTLPLYLVFGRNRFNGYLEKRNEIEDESLLLIQRTSGNIQEHIVPVVPETPMYTSLFNLARMPATGGRAHG